MTYVELLHAESEFVASNRTDNQTLLIPGISFSLVPRNYLGEALFSRALYAELRGSHSALGSDSDFLQVRMQAERVFDFAPKWHVLMRGDIGATAVVANQQLSRRRSASSPAAIAACAASASTTCRPWSRPPTRTAAARRR